VISAPCFLLGSSVQKVSSSRSVPKPSPFWFRLVISQRIDTPQVVEVSGKERSISQERNPRDAFSAPSRAGVYCCSQNRGRIKRRLAKEFSYALQTRRPRVAGSSRVAGTAAVEDSCSSRLCVDRRHPARGSDLVPLEWLRVRHGYAAEG